MFRFTVIVLIVSSVISKSVYNCTSTDGKDREMELLKSQIQNLTERLDKVVPEQKHVFFFVRLTPATTLNKNSIVKFDQVITDSGNNFNSGDGIFVAPIAGYYQFSWTTFIVNSKSQDTELRVDNKVIDSMYGYPGASSYISNTKVVICKVENGDHVWIQTSRRYSENIFSIPNDSRASFTGLLLQKI